MFRTTHKSKQYWLTALKVLILAFAFGYIYQKLTNSETLQLSAFIATLRTKHVVPIFLFIGFAALNWIFEILKWRTVISIVKSLTFKTAARQSLASLTASLATPNRIGDYGAKAYFFQPKDRKQVLLLNFFSNSAQMGVTTLFGIAGFIYTAQQYGITYSGAKLGLVALTILSLVVLGYVFKEKQLLLKGLSISRMLGYIKRLSTRIKSGVLLYSLLRYITFSSLFVLMLNYFGASLPVTEALPLVFAMYLLVSIIPSVFILDVVIRSGVAVWLFSLAGVPEWPVLCTVLGMWLLNFALPALWGSFYVITYKHPDS